MAYNVAANLRQTRPGAAFMAGRDNALRNALNERDMQLAEGSQQFSQQNALMQRERQARMDEAAAQQQEQAAQIDERKQLLNAFSHLDRAYKVAPEQAPAVSQQLLNSQLFRKYGIRPEDLTPESIATRMPVLAAEAGVAPVEPEKPAEYTLGPGQARFVGGEQVASMAPTPSASASRSFRTITKEEAKLLGLPDGGVYQMDNNTGQVSVVSKAPDTRSGGGGGLPVGALRIVDEARQAINSSKESLGLVDRAVATINSGKVNLGMFNNAVARGRNLAGASSEASRAYTDVRQTFEKLRNNYLLLAKGVQTEGDAQRAWNSEIGESAQNDNKLAVQQLSKARSLIERMVQMQGDRIETVYANYGARPPEIGGGAPTTAGGQNQPVRVNTPEEAAALPSGTEFITPDGRRKVRP